MRVGLDFRAMQIGHQFRGIGQVVREACRALDRGLPADDSLVLFHDPDGAPVAHILGEVGIDERRHATVALPRARDERVRRFVGGMSPAQERTVQEACDVLVQPDFALGVPDATPTVLFVYDQIPILLGDRFPEAYRPTYRVARASGASVRWAARRALSRLTYERGLTAALAAADTVLAISEHTAGTTRQHAAAHGLGDISDRVVVAPLGHDRDATVGPDLDVLEAARVAGLGLDERPFLLFMGGVDARRRIDLLVTAFNNLRAEGRDLRLVLAGYDFRSTDTIFTPAARDAILGSSYRHDIELLGYVSDAERSWLYDRAAAFVFPTEHEGFGLPVVEALAAGCTVVSFDTTSISELGRGPNCYLCEPSWRDLASTIVEVMERPADRRARDAEGGREFAASFTWERFGRTLVTRVERHRAR